ncbi:Carboxypeptidase regulatory-like domain-containing protein [Salinimicrobium sediminis]|uniref:Carboxypeptidase regulatory-like domain-containing protein n=1 Tax=Salinimicrobium sediminis TaxID=1343891 RepID=A0A285X490_9FLAO|nr:DUF4382 domain-containing protein [Salinimicrobium sediminis]SOC79199.1 Carboxypeptidase regulatory-like domain-containing protein [Salinimicrobium sediminis]
MKKYHLFFFLFALTAGFVSCSSDDDSAGSDDGKARVAIKLTDAPGDYEEVLVEVEDVMIKTTAEGSEEEGWVSLEGVNTGVIDLLSLTGGVTELLVDAELEAGYLHQIRLVLGDNNTIKVDENGTIKEYALKTPSAEQSGLKVMVGQELEADEDYTFILDFDVDKSVVVTGNGTYNLKPVIRMAVEENTGSIVGSVHPTTEQVLIKAESGTMNASAYTDANGNFQIHGLPAGTFRVTATPAAGLGLNVTIVNNVTVTKGEVTTLEGGIFLDGSAEVE